MIDKTSLKCKHYPGYIYRSDDPDYKRWYLDQLAEASNIWISFNKFGSYLLDTYGITIQEYYNIVVFDDINHIELCHNPNCNNQVDFIGLFTGYRWNCSNSCTSIQNCKDEIIQESFVNSRKRLPDLSIKLDYNRFVNQGNPTDAAYFYISYDKNNYEYIKFGITYKLYRRYKELNCSHIRVLKSTRLIVAELEKTLKLWVLQEIYSNNYADTYEWIPIKYFRDFMTKLESELLILNKNLKCLQKLKEL